MIGSIKADKVYTAEECNQLCKDDVSEVRETCSMFALGRSDGKNYGKCYLLKGACTKSTDVSYDIWFSTPRFPSNFPAV